MEQKIMKQIDNIQNIECLEINLTKDEKDLYITNYNTMLREIKEHLSKWRDISYS